MSAVSTSLIVFACVLGGAFLGLALQKILPEPHRNSESKDLIRAGTGLIATISALVLGLLVASAKGTYDTQKDEVTAQAAKTALLDQILEHYGPETREIRLLLREVVAEEVQRVWDPAGKPMPPQGSRPGKRLYDLVQDLSPTNEPQRAIKTHAGQLIVEMAQTSWLMEAQKGSAVSGTLLTVVVFWLTINFVSFGLFAPRNATAASTLFICALSVAGAVFLILEMDQPFRGLIRIPDTTLRALLGGIGS